MHAAADKLTHSCPKLVRDQIFVVGVPVSDNRGVLIIGEETVLTGEIKNCREIEIYGHVDGKLDAGNIIVHQQGSLFGTVKAETAEIHGTMQGDVRIKQLISIKSSGTVNGNVKYGRLAMEEGAELAATVRNVPPSVAGDLDLSVTKGRSVRITTADLTAIDPDDKAANLTFSVSNAANGFVTFAARRVCRSPRLRKPISKTARFCSPTMVLAAIPPSLTSSSPTKPAQRRAKRKP